LVLVASGVAFATKLAGYLVPPAWLTHPRVARVSHLLPIAMLAALVATQTFGGHHGRLQLDARVVGLVVALVALRLRAPFVVVVVLAASATAFIRLI
jgi:uncharacterized membrane protein